MLGIELAVFSVGTAGVERDLVGLEVGIPEVVAERIGGLACGIEVAEAMERTRDSCPSAASSDSFRRVLGMGSAGNGPEGGNRGDSDDVDGRRETLLVMVAVAVDIGRRRRQQKR